jgi:CHAD domain-containing protein
MAMRHPHSILRSRLGELCSLLPGVKDGDVDAVHDARVVTRRLRELLPVVSIREAKPSDAMTRIRRAGRAMGEVRELDVLQSLLDDLEGRATFAAHALAAMRVDVRDAQAVARRRMVKALERLKLDTLDSQLRQHTSWNPFSRVRFGEHWTRQLRARVGERASDLGKALRRVTGVYMPNRAHAARVAVKKLRYAVEIAGDTGLWHSPDSLRELRRAQASLGDIHDLQVLADRVERSTPDAGDVCEWRWLRDLLTADMATAHHRFTERRERLEFAVAAAGRWGKGRSIAWPVRALVLPLTVSAAVVPLLVKPHR